MAKPRDKRKGKPKWQKILDRRIGGFESLPNDVKGSRAFRRPGSKKGGA